MTELQRAMKDATDIVDVAKNVKIYPAIINTKEAWDKLLANTIVKCFMKCGIHDAYIKRLNLNNRQKLMTLIAGLVICLKCHVG